MFFVLSKILLFLLKPVIWVFCLFTAAVFSENVHKRRRLLITGVLIFFIFSNTFIVGKICNAYEAKYPALQTYDIGIVLGGFSSLNKRNNELVFNGSGDRLLQTITLYKRGVIKKILISSGNANLLDNKVKEADMVASYLKEIGIPDSALLIENQSRNTIENATNSLKLVRKTQANAKILVITSAWHIPRAKLIFSKYFGNHLTYYPTNYMGKTEYEFSEFILPSAIALSNWEIIIKEWVGYVVDNFRS